MRAGLLGFLLLVLAAPRTAGAHSARDVLALARICVSEASWSFGTNDCAAIARVLERRHLGSIHRAARRYCPNVMGAAKPRSARERWISALAADASQPAGWPLRGPAWALYAYRWRRWLIEARRILRARVSPCRPEPDHWGGEMDRALARRRGFVRVDCGDTLNDFYRVGP